MPRGDEAAASTIGGKLRAIIKLGGVAIVCSAPHGVTLISVGADCMLARTRLYVRLASGG